MVARLVARLALFLGVVLGGLLVPGAGALTPPLGNPAAAVGLEVESPAPQPDALLANWRPDAPDRATRDAAIAASVGATQVSAGGGHTCALTADGGVMCWGWNNYGQLGDGSNTDYLTAVGVAGLASGVAAVSAGGGHTCALTTDGGVKCWGWNEYGQLGNEMTLTSLTPVDVVDLTSGVATVSAGDIHTCAVTSAGGLKCWGHNGSGQLGDRSNTDRLTPVGVDGLTSGVASVSAGIQHTCAVTSAGGLKCWGWNEHGQLGDGSMTDRAAPVNVVGLSSGVDAVSAGGILTCAVTTTGGVKCWGHNGFGELGDGFTTNRVTPVDVVGLASGVSAVSAGDSHTCAVTTAGGLKCWGHNDVGQIGDGMTTDRATPVDVVGLSSGVAAVSAGGAHTCALNSAGGLKCWGHNGFGQLGDGFRTNRVTPVDVVLALYRRVHLPFVSRP